MLSERQDGLLNLCDGIKETGQRSSNKNWLERHTTVGIAGTHSAGLRVPYASLTGLFHSFRMQLSDHAWSWPCLCVVGRYTGLKPQCNLPMPGLGYGDSTRSGLPAKWGLVVGMHASGQGICTCGLHDGLRSHSFARAAPHNLGIWQVA